MKVLVTGGRDYPDDALVDIVLDRLHREAPITQIIEGGATGADKHARAWARKRGVPNRTFKADWLRFKGAAGPIRNRQMLTEGKPDIVVAFPGGRGTSNMVDEAMRNGVVVEHAARERKDAIEATANAFNRNPSPRQSDGSKKGNGT